MTRGIRIRSLLLGVLLMVLFGAAVPRPTLAENGFKPIPTQFIAARAAPTATSGSGAEAWGLWTLDPGPRGVRLRNYEALVAAGGTAPANWSFDAGDWWLEEHGLIMEAPTLGLPPGRYLVTGNRAAQAVLTVSPKDASGAQAWSLSCGATVYDVTHLRCRSARYRPNAAGKACTPASVPAERFPVAPGDAMPPVANCSKVDYAVLFIIGIEG